MPEKRTNEYASRRAQCTISPHLVSCFCTSLPPRPALSRFGDLDTTNIIPRIQRPVPHWRVFHSERRPACPATDGSGHPISSNPASRAPPEIRLALSQFLRVSLARGPLVMPPPNTAFPATEEKFHWHGVSHFTLREALVCTSDGQPQGRASTFLRSSHSPSILVTGARVHQFTFNLSVVDLRSVSIFS